MQGLGRLALASCVLGLISCSQSTDSQPAPESAGVGSGGFSGQASAGGGGGGRAELEGAGSPSQNSAGESGATGASDGGAAGAGDSPGAVEVQTILDTYRAFAPRTPEPVAVSSYIFNLCRLPTLREEEFLQSIHGSGRYLRDWVNPLAAQALASRAAVTFPVGAVIVKEKYAGPTSLEPDLVAIGVMIKRAAGFDPAHGDWDYAYYEPALGIVQSSAQTEHCGNCHAAAAASDFVYVDGLKP